MQLWPTTCQSHHVVQGKENFSNRTGIESTIRSHTIRSYCKALFLLVGYGEKYPPLHIRDAGMIHDRLPEKKGWLGSLSLANLSGTHLTSCLDHTTTLPLQDFLMMSCRGLTNDLMVSRSSHGQWNAHTGEKNAEREAKWLL